MKAIILAGGFAKRLWPLTKDQAKPLLPIAGKPMIAHTMEKIFEIDEADKIFISTNKKFEPNFRSWLEEFQTKGAKGEIKLIIEPTLSEDEKLGSIGAVNFLLEQEKIDDDVLIISADNVFESSLLEMYRIFKEKRIAVNGLYDCKSKKTAQEQGTVIIDENNMFSGFEEKAKEPKSTLISMGVYFLPKEILGLFGKYIKEGNNRDSFGYFVRWLMEKEGVLGFVVSGRWFDIGWIESYREADEWFRGKWSAEKRS